MRYSRQNKILDLIAAYDVETQDQLVTLLNENGYQVTQATVSRDIKELQLIKTQTSAGRYKYAVAAPQEQPVSDRFVKIFRETIKSVQASGNIIVVKTLSGCANAAAEAIDTMDFSGIVGSLAGDNTIFLVVSENVDANELVNQFRDMLNA